MAILYGYDRINFVTYKNWPYEKCDWSENIMFLELIKMSTVKLIEKKCILWSNIYERTVLSDSQPVLFGPLVGAQTKRPKTKGPKDKMSQETKRPKDKMSQDKTSQGTKRPKRQKVPSKKKFYTSISNISKTDFVWIFLKMSHLCYCIMYILLFWAG